VPTNVFNSSDVMRSTHGNGSMLTSG
jgi:hypothetical protein